jgi:hypothetical protein
MPNLRRKKPPQWLQIGPIWLQAKPPQWIQLAVARGAKRAGAVRVRYRPDNKAAGSSIILAYHKTKKKKRGRGEA